MTDRRGRGAASGYNAFISYSHGADKEFAPSLQLGLRKLAKPWNKRYALRVFLDQTSLSASADLKSDLDGPISQSEFFILLASKQAADPKSWVSKEVGYWLENKEVGKFLIAKTDGEISWDAATNDFDWEKTTALPRSLARAFPSEPNYVDFGAEHWQAGVSFHDPEFKTAVARLAAPIHGKEMDELVGEDIKQQRRTKRLVRAAVTTLVVLLIAASAAAVVAYQQRNTAIQAKNKAIQERNRALVALFQNLSLNIGAGQNAGSLCFTASSRCVYGHEIAGVGGLLGTPIPLGTLGKTVAYLDADVPTSTVFVAASESGKGRVIGYAHDGLVIDVLNRTCGFEPTAKCREKAPRAEPADNLTFDANALGWVMGPTPTGCPKKNTVAIYEGWETVAETHEIAGLARQRGWTYKRILPNSDPGKLSSRLHCVNALIWGNPWGAGADWDPAPRVSDPALAAVVTYVKNGGGLLLGGLGWSWAQETDKPMGDYPANRLASAFGFAFTRDAYDLGAELQLRPPPA